DALRMNMMISYQELVRTFPSKLRDIEIRRKEGHRGLHIFYWHPVIMGRIAPHASRRSLVG
ncbi:hypothetical protein DJ490_22590, partial [Enterobacter hormaechei]